MSANFRLVPQINMTRDTNVSYIHVHGTDWSQGENTLGTFN